MEIFLCPCCANVYSELKMLLIIWASLNPFLFECWISNDGNHLFKSWNNATHDTHNWVMLPKANSEERLLESGKSSHKWCVLGYLYLNMNESQPRFKNYEFTANWFNCRKLANSFFSHLICWKRSFHFIWITSCVTEKKFF